MVLLFYTNYMHKGPICRTGKQSMHQIGSSTIISAAISLPSLFSLPSPSWREMEEHLKVQTPQILCTVSALLAIQQTPNTSLSWGCNELHHARYQPHMASSPFQPLDLGLLLGPQARHHMLTSAHRDPSNCTEQDSPPAIQPAQGEQQGLFHTTAVDATNVSAASRSHARL